MEHICSRSLCQASQKSPENCANPHRMGNFPKNKAPIRLIETVSLTLIFWTIAPPLTQNETTKNGKKKARHSAGLMGKEVFQNA